MGYALSQAFTGTGPHWGVEIGECWVSSTLASGRNAKLFWRLRVASLLQRIEVLPDRVELNLRVSVGNVANRGLTAG